MANVMKMISFLFALLVFGAIVFAVEDEISSTPSPTADVASGRVVEKETNFSFVYLGVVALLIGFAALYNHEKN